MDLLLKTSFKPNEIDNLLCDVKFIKNNKKEEYGNVAFTFDIETSSFYRNIDTNEIVKYVPDGLTPKQNSRYEKCATMYAWVIGLDGKTIIGRTWEEAMNCFIKIATYYDLNSNKRLICYVHNLAYEFQFIRKRFNWSSIFALETRKPLKCLTSLGIEFRCSYLLSGMNLASVGNNLLKYKVNKMVGDLDYQLLRHSYTPLTDAELGYIRNDALVVMAFIQEEIENNGDITRIPLTKTGYVRNYCRNSCLYQGNHKNKESQKKYYHYHDIIQSLKIISVEEYMQLKRAFQGGYTHASCWWSNKIRYNVDSFDFTSSYPSVMISYAEYPMSYGKCVKPKNKKEFEFYLKNYACLFDAKFGNLRSDFINEHYLSLSKCYKVKNPNVDNGRIVSATELITTITNIDFEIIQATYKWDRMQIQNMKIYRKGYLPTDFVKAIIKLYEDKTTLKGLDDKVVEYMLKKSMLNACYGMAVTDICRPDIVYNADNEWEEVEANLEEQLEHYNNSKSRFLFYHWGIWVTALARRCLWLGNGENTLCITQIDNDYIYADTDSLKITNVNKHMDKFHNYNNNQHNLLVKAMEYHKLPIECVEPKTIKGEIKPLGYWDKETNSSYKRFKTLGAKRYLIEDVDGEYHLTTSGINKHVCIPYLKDRCANEKVDMFDLFTDDLYIPKGYSGKNIHTYIDYNQKGFLMDYLGKIADWSEMGSVHIEESDYSLSLSEQYIEYLRGVQYE